MCPLHAVEIVKSVKQSLITYGISTREFASHDFHTTPVIGAFYSHIARTILVIVSAMERRSYDVMPSFIGRARTQNDPCTAQRF